jgi:hypothetical protein
LPTWFETREFRPSWSVSICSTPVTLVLSSCSTTDLSIQQQTRRGYNRLTLRSVASLIISSEPAQILVFDPRDPVLIQIMAFFFGPLCVALLRFLFLFGSQFRGVNLLFDILCALPDLFVAGHVFGMKKRLIRKLYNR